MQKGAGGAFFDCEARVVFDDPREAGVGGAFCTQSIYSFRLLGSPTTAAGAFFRDDVGLLFVWSGRFVERRASD